MKFLRKLLFIVLLTVPVKTIFSQDDYYIYIESLNHQPFYVRIGHETFTSSGNGYLLVPGLTSNTYDLIVGFPGVNISEWRFSLPVANKDLGFVLEEKGSKAPRLSYMDQKQALTGSAVKQKKEETREVTLPQGVTSNDPFSTLLAAVVNDPTIRMPVLVEAISIPPAVEAQPDSVKAFVADTVSIVQQKNLAAVTSPVTPPEKATDQKIKEGKRETIQEQTPPVEKESKFIVKSETKPPVENKEEKSKTAIAVPVEKESKSIVKSETKPPVENKEEGSKEAIAVPVEKESKSLVKSETKPAVENKEEKGKTAIAVLAQKESKSLVKSETKPPVENKEEKDKTAAEVPAEKKYESFVIRETPMSDSKTPKSIDVAKAPETTSGTTIKENEQSVVVKNEKNVSQKNKKEERRSETTVKETAKDTQPQSGYLPFVIKPGGETDSVAESKQPVNTVATGDNSTEKAIQKPPVEKSDSETVKEAEKPKVVLTNVRKTLERKGRDGIDLIFIDENINGSKDTIRIFIPSQHP